MTDTINRNGGAQACGVASVRSCLEVVSRGGGKASRPRLSVSAQIWQASWAWLHGDVM